VAYLIQIYRWVWAVCGVALAMLGLGAAAQNLPAPAPSGKGVQLVQRIDDVLVGVDPISLAIIDRQHVSGIAVRVSPNLPGAVQDYRHFVADCQSPLRLVVLNSAPLPMELTPQGASARARVAQAQAVLKTAAFANVTMLDGSRAMAEFACQTTARPAQAAQIAKELFEAGGPPDVRTALCDLQPDGAFVTREDVQVRFSDAEKVVAVANQWLSSGQVTQAEISFGSGGSRWRIDRNTAEASLIGGDGKLLFMGSCIAKDKSR
jgi:hypothetical protein